MSDESDAGIPPKNHKGKRKNAIITSSFSDSDSSASNIPLSKRSCKRKNRITESESDSSIETARKQRRIPRVTESESESSDSSQIIRTKRSKRILSDEDSSSSSEDSDFGTDNDYEEETDENWESDWQSGGEDLPKEKEKLKPSMPLQLAKPAAAKVDPNFSDSSDGNSEKCPICLLSFNGQEVGTPETCDHSFCADCIHEWSKNVNTCPVDRLTFTLILVRKYYDGKVVRQISVDNRRASVDELIHEDPTFCEICGLSDREDRLLLCDGCDLGYHLECLEPPLDTVPLEEWFCSECRLPSVLHDQQNTSEDNSRANQHRRSRHEYRLVPRTSQSERVRAMIATNRNSALLQDQASNSSGFESFGGPGPSRTNNALTHNRGTTKSTQKKTKKKRRRTRRKKLGEILRYDICTETGKKIPVRKKSTRRKRKYKRKKVKRVIVPKTVKKRLAIQLGMCPPKKIGQAIPEVKMHTHSNNNINFQRSQAGIPTLHLFGRRDQLDYFSGSEEDMPASYGNVLLQARTASSSATSLRRAARRKAGFIPAPPASVSSCDVLGSILNSQENLYSKNSIITVDSNGTVNIKSKSTNNNNSIIRPNTEQIVTAPELLDLTSNGDHETTQAPMFPGRSGGGNRQPYFNRGGGYRGGGNMYEGGSHYNYQNQGGPRGRGYNNQGMYNHPRENFGYSNYHNVNNHSTPPNYRARGPPRFPVRRPQLQPLVHRQTEELPPIELQLDDSIENAIGNSDSARQEEEVDIYSDIETGSPTQEDPPDEVKSPPMDLQPAAVPLSFSNSVSDEDSDRELVIDDSVKDSDKYDPADPSNDTDSNSQPPKLEKVDEFLRSEEITVPVDEELGTVSVESENISVQSASVNSSAALNLSSIPSVTSQVVDEAVQQVLKEHLGNSTISNIQNDDDFSDEDCPNFSIYSAESIHIAKSTDSNIPKDISDEQSQDDEVIEKVDEMVVNAMEKEEELVEEVEEGIETSESAKEDLIEDEKGFKDDMEVIPNEIENKVDNKEIFEESQNDDEIVRREDITNKDDINVKDSENDQKSDGELDDFSDEEKLEDIFSKEDTVEEKFDDMQNHEKSQELKSTSEPSSTPIKIAFDPKRKSKTQVQSSKSLRVLQLYDDSDLEEWESKNELDKTLKPADKSAENANELDKMTEAISEEERSYTPCLDEKEPLKNQFSDDEHNTGAGIGGMDTEMISEDERNDIFDESHDMKTISDGDALEINAKESELDITRAEDYEEGEIIERVTKKVLQEEQETEKADESVAEEQPIKVPSLTKKKDKEDKEKEPKEKARREDNTDKAGKKTEFKKLSKSNKERNYRDKEKERKSSKGKSQERKSRDDKENNRKEKRRDRKRGDLERYSVRSLIQEKPRKDQFGRDETRHRSASRGSQTPSPRRSTSRSRRSASHDRSKKRRRRSRSVRRSRSRSMSRGYSPVSRARSLRRSKSRGRSRSNRRSSKSPRNKKSRAYHSTSRDRYKRKKTPDRGGVKPKGKKNRSGSRTRVRSRTPASFTKHRGREWERKQSFSREWTPSWSRSPSPRPLPRHNLPQSMSPSWTPPLAHEKGPVQPENLTVILTNNEVNKKKKDKKKKADKKTREEFKKRKRSERTPPPSKEVFASGDNILVSVSFNKTGDDSTVGTREVMGVKRKRETLTESLKKQKKDRLKEKKKRGTSPKAKKKKNKEIANMKPVAIIDLDRSPFKELTPSPKDIIVLSDSDNCEKGDESMGHIQEEMTTMEVQNQEDSAPQSPNNYLNSTGPKTPPEPQIKFLLSSKQNQIRVISNPLHDPTEEVEAELDPQEELEQRLNDVLHKGPNTPPDPPISPPSSPDAYDPFDPTKSPSPEPQTNSQISIQKAAEKNSENENDLVDLAVGPLELSQKSVETGDKRTSPNNASSKRLSLSPDRTSQTRERTSPSDSQQIDSEPTKNESSDKVSKSPPERTIGVVINQQVQQTSIFPTVVKPISTSVYSSVTPAIITSTPTLSNSSLPRTNLFNTPSLNTPRIAQSAVPQRIILPTPSKSSPAKMSPAKPPIKSTPIKPMPSSKTMISKLPVPNVKPITPMRKGNQSKPANRNQNGNEVIDVDMDFESPYSPGSSDYEDLFEPPVETSKSNNNNRQQKNTKSPAKQNVFDNLFGSTSPVYRPPAANKGKQKSNSAKTAKSKKTTPSKHASNKTHVGVKLDEDNLKILDDLPNSAVEMQVKDKFLKKLNRQERVVEEVKLVLKPHYNKKHVTKEQYKDILRRSVPKENIYI